MTVTQKRFKANDPFYQPRAPIVPNSQNPLSYRDEEVEYSAEKYYAGEYPETMLKRLALKQDKDMQFFSGKSKKLMIGKKTGDRLWRQIKQRIKQPTNEGSEGSGADQE